MCILVLERSANRSPDRIAARNPGLSNTTSSRSVPADPADSVLSHSASTIRLNEGCSSQMALVPRLKLAVVASLSVRLLADGVSVRPAFQ